MCHIPRLRPGKMPGLSPPATGRNRFCHYHIRPHPLKDLKNVHLVPAGILLRIPLQLDIVLVCTKHITRVWARCREAVLVDYISQRMTNSINQSINQSINRLANQSVRQLVNQLINQSINHWTIRWIVRLIAQSFFFFNRTSQEVLPNSQMSGVCFYSRLFYLKKIWKIIYWDYSSQHKHYSLLYKLDNTGWECILRMSTKVQITS